MTIVSAPQVLLVIKNLPAKVRDIRDMGLIPGLAMEKGMVTHSSVLS